MNLQNVIDFLFANLEILFKFGAVYILFGGSVYVIYSMYIRKSKRTNCKGGYSNYAFECFLDRY